MSYLQTRLNSLSPRLLQVLLSLGVGILFERFIFQLKYPGLGWTVFFLGVIAAFLVFVKRHNLQLSTGKKLLLLFPAILSLFLTVRFSIELLILDIFVTLFVIFFAVRVVPSKSIKDLAYSDFLLLPFLPIRFIKPFFEQIQDLLQFKGENKRVQVIKQVMAGIIVTIPVLVLLTALLASADLVFNSFIDQIFSFQFDLPQLFWRLFVIGLASLGSFSVFAYVRSAINTPTVPANEFPKGASNIEGYILLTSVSVLFLIFIIIQFKYLFLSSDLSFLQNYTFAEYARKGFFELIVVAVLSFGLLNVVEKYFFSPSTVQSKFVKLLNTLVGLEVLIILYSALRRLGLYEDAYGFTVARLFAHTLLLFLAFVFIFILVKVNKPIRESSFILGIVSVGAAVLIVINLANPAAIVAKKNLDRFYKTDKIDMYYMLELKTDAADYIVEALKIVPEDQKQDAYRIFINDVDELEKHGPGFREFNFSRKHALRLYRIERPAIEAELRQLEEKNPLIDNSMKIRD